MMDPNVAGMGNDVPQPAMAATPNQPALDPNAAAQKAALAAALAKMGGMAATNGASAMRGQMVGNHFAAPNTATQGLGALAQFAPALQAFMKRPAPMAPAGVAAQPVAPQPVSAPDPMAFGGTQ